jgi:uncharacterized protein (UPF0335 family)
MADIGHNVGGGADGATGVAADRLRSIVERIERLEDERRAIGEDIKDIYTEAKSAGFVPKVLRNLIAERRRAAGEVSEEQMLLETYKRALGMLADTPLGQAAMGRAS